MQTLLKRALKIAHAAQQQSAVARKAADTEPVALFVEILNNYIYYFEQELPNITPSVLQVSMHLHAPLIDSDHISFLIEHIIKSLPLSMPSPCQCANSYVMLFPDAEHTSALAASSIVHL